jgi:hypothetical protein
MRTKPPSFEDVRRIALSLPGVEEGLSYGTPGFRVSGRLFARIKEDGVTLVVRTDRDTRDILLEANPAAFFVTPHYQGYDWMLIRLGDVTLEELREQLFAAWKRRANARLRGAGGADGPDGSPRLRPPAPGSQPRSRASRIGGRRRTRRTR